MNSTNLKRGFLRDLAKSEQAVSVVEFALALPLIISLTLGIIDYGLAAKCRMAVFSAAHVGVQYAALHGWNKAAVESAAKQSTNLQMSVVGVSYCGCPSKNKIVKQTCRTYCSSGAEAGKYVDLSTSYNYEPLFPGIWQSADREGSIQLNSNVITRVE